MDAHERRRSADARIAKMNCSRPPTQAHGDRDAPVPAYRPRCVDHLAVPNCVTRNCATARCPYLEAENAKLKRLYADLALENSAIRELLHRREVRRFQQPLRHYQTP